MDKLPYFLQNATKCLGDMRVKAIKHEACPCNSQCLHHNVESLEIESFSKGSKRACERS